MRDAVLIQLVDRAQQDPDFLRRAKEDPEAAVREAGFELDEDELAALIDLRREVLQMDDAELEQRLARRQGGG